MTRQQILDSSKLKEFADDNFKFDKNGKKLSNWVENTVRKAEIARYEQFLLFPLCFQKACFPGASKSVIVWEWVNSFKNTLKETCPIVWVAPMIVQSLSRFKVNILSNNRYMKIQKDFERRQIQSCKR